MLNSRFLYALVGISLLANIAVAQGVSECYGETLEVQIQIYAPDQPNEGQVILSLPNPDLWSMIGRDGAGSLHDAGCLEEPVLVSRVYGSGMQSKFQRAMNNPPRALSQIVSLDLGGGLRQSVSEGLYVRNVHKSRAWLDIPHGFRRFDSLDDQLFMEYGGRKFASGLFYFPETYPTPMGPPVTARCSIFGYCQVDYRLHERLGIHYKFRSSRDYGRLWIPQDQALRDLINSWVTDLPIRD